MPKEPTRDNIAVKTKPPQSRAPLPPSAPSRHAEDTLCGLGQPAPRVTMTTYAHCTGEEEYRSVAKGSPIDDNHRARNSTARTWDKDKRVAEIDGKCGPRGLLKPPGPRAGSTIPGARIE